MKTDPKTAIETAMAILSGRDGEPSADDYVRAYESFLEVADSGLRGPAAPFAFSKLAAMTGMGCGTPRDVQRACVYFVDAVMTGFPPALRDMAVILDGTSGDKGVARNLLMRAAGGGDKIAAYLVGAWKKREPPVDAAAINMQDLKTAVASIFDSAPIVNSKSLSPNLPVHAHAGALTPMQCDYLMAVSSPLLQPSKVVDGTHDKAMGAHANFRTSDGVIFLPSHMDMPVLQIITKLAGLANGLPHQGEFLALLRYTPGQEYRPHHDYLPEDAHDYAKVKACGQRRATVLTYLNEGYGGGETEFPELGVKYKGGQGDSLVFANVGDDGRGLPQSLHAGTPVTHSEKWLVTLWMREKRFWPW